MHRAPLHPCAWRLHAQSSFARDATARAINAFMSAARSVRLVKNEMQSRHGVNVQALEQAITQKTSGLVQRFCRPLGVASEQAEEHLGVRVVRRHLHTLDGHHADAGVLQFAGDQLRQIALNLVGDAKTAIGGTGLFTQTKLSDYRVRAISLISKNSSWSFSLISL